MLGPDPLSLIGPCLPPFLGSLAGCAQVVSPKVLAPFGRGQLFSLSFMFGHDLEPKIFWGHETRARGGRSLHRLRPALIPMGGWCGSSAPKELRLRARKPREKLVVHLPPAPPEANNSR